MPNINLLNGKDFSQEVEKIDPDAVSSEDFQAVEEKPSIVEETAETIAEQPEEKVVAEKEISPEPSPVVDDTYPRFRERSSNMPLIIGTVAVIIVAILFVFLYSRYNGGEKEKMVSSPQQETADTTASTELPGTGSQEGLKQPATPTEGEAKPENTPVKEQPGTQQPAANRLATVSSPGLSATRAAGVVGASLLGDVQSSMPSGVELLFFRYGNGMFTTEIAAPSGNLLTQFEQNLKAKDSAAKTNILSEREMLISGQVMKIRQISGKLPVTGSAPLATQTLASDRIKRDFAAKARTFGLKTDQIEISPVVSSQGRKLKLVTLKTSGSQDNILNFISGLTKSYGNVGIKKMMVSRLSPSQADNSRLMAILDLDIYLD